MTVKINLEPVEKLRVSLNYQYPLSAAIYKLICQSSPEFAEWLHKIGYKFNDSITYKMFTFSKLFTEKPSKDKLDKGILEANGNASFFFASPANETMMNKFIKGALKCKEFLVSTPVASSKFIISSIERQPEVQLFNNMNYKMLSPTCVSIYDNNEKLPRFLMPDEDIEGRIADNLSRKYKAIYEKNYEEKIKVKLDKNWKRKAIKSKEATSQESTVFAFESHLLITANPEIQNLALNAGIGERNSMGCGMIKVLPHEDL